MQVIIMILKMYYEILKNHDYEIHYEIYLKSSLR